MQMTMFLTNNFKVVLKNKYVTQTLYLLNIYC